MSPDPVSELGAVEKVARELHAVNDGFGTWHDYEKDARRALSSLTPTDHLRAAFSDEELESVVDGLRFFEDRREDWSPESESSFQKLAAALSQKGSE